VPPSAQSTCPFAQEIHQHGCIAYSSSAIYLQKVNHRRLERPEKAQLTGHFCVMK
jgi:hypothetical protein